MFVMECPLVEANFQVRLKAECTSRVKRVSLQESGASQVMVFVSSVGTDQRSQRQAGAMTRRNYRWWGCRSGGNSLFNKIWTQ